jgi:hypothetical protein
LEEERFQFLEEDFPRNGEGKASLRGREDQDGSRSAWAQLEGKPMRPIPELPELVEVGEGPVNKGAAILEDGYDGRAN